MARASRLKLFRTPMGFFDAVVAAPSQAAALKAWGVSSNLFAEGLAEEVKDDPALLAEASATPGAVLRKPRGVPAELLSRPTPDARALKARKPAPAPTGPPAPARAAPEAKADRVAKVAVHRAADRAATAVADPLRRPAVRQADKDPQERRDQLSGKGKARRVERADTITVFGEGRGFRVVWLLEEMGLPYRLRRVDLLAGVENDPEFLAINPAGFIPALQDGDVTLVESIAIMEYLLARYGPTPLAPAPQDPAFPAYQQFLHLGEAGLAASIYFVNGARNLAPAAERDNWSARQALNLFETRLSLVTRRLTHAPWMAGDGFTAADISVVYALELAARTVDYPLGEAELAYVARATARAAYARAMAACHDTRAWTQRVRARAEKR